MLAHDAGSIDAEPSTGGETYEVGLRIGPAAASLLRQYKLQAKQIKPSGPHNMVTKGDVLAAIESGVKPLGSQKESPQACSRAIAHPCKCPAE